MTLSRYSAIANTPTIGKTRGGRTVYRVSYPPMISTKALTISYGLPLGMFLMGTIWFLAGYGITPLAVVVIPGGLIWTAVLLVCRSIYRRKFMTKRADEKAEFIFL